MTAEHNSDIHAVLKSQREMHCRKAPPEITLTERNLWNINPEDHHWRSQYLHEMPDYLASYFGERYQRLFAQHQGRRRANTFLRQTIGESVLPRLQHVKKRYQLSDAAQHELPFIRQLERLAILDRQQLRELAYKASTFIAHSLNAFVAAMPSSESPDEYAITITTYRYLAELTALSGTAAPYWADYRALKGALPLRKAQSGLLRMMSPEWWGVRLKRMRDVQREHMAIAVGQVQKAASPYVSRGALHEWKEQKKRNRDFFKRFDLVSEEGDRVALDEMVNRSVANPAIRRRELMTRMRGFEDVANEIGCIGAFYTITAPSRYHAVYSQGGFISQWNGCNPSDTQRYLCRVWSRIRAALSRKGIQVFGFRVVEPHHDGTPHWHLLLFMPQQHAETVEQVMREYACKEDCAELVTPQARKARFHVEPIDPTKGSATGYIAKYISKNIDGYALDGEHDDETGASLRDMAKAVSAWASRWRIRQFQQIGGAPVTVWRELRRLGTTQLQDSKMDAVLASASVASCWASYTMAQGGPLVAREDLVVRLCYELTEMGNEYGEDVQRVQGIYSPRVPDSEVVTRLVKWEKVAKFAAATAEAGSSGGPAAPWSSVNNCTGAERRRSALKLKMASEKQSSERICANLQYGRLKLHPD